jgi:ATP/maltotriose-dependent transcriptional regulator MalT
MEPQKTSLSVSKYTPPRLPRILYRSRLLKLIEQNKDKKLLLILGQAAQGKSTLAASYVHNLAIRKHGAKAGDSSIQGMDKRYL